ncbi:hypothetical protein ACYOEI_39215, partial [Singulisphaera rosea]
MSKPQSDALVFFGATGDLAYKKIFPALHSMAKRDHLHVPVIGVAKAGWGLDQLKARARESIEHSGIPRDQVDAYWALAQRRVGVGGTDPGLQASMLHESMPDQNWISYVGPDEGALERLSASGRLVCSTMSWGELYGNRLIAHWVNVNHINRRQNLACFEDNNDPPGVYRWTTATEFFKRAYYGGQAWVFAFEQKARTLAASSHYLIILAAALLLLATTVVVL